MPVRSTQPVNPRAGLFKFGFARSCVHSDFQAKPAGAAAAASSAVPRGAQAEGSEKFHILGQQPSTPRLLDPDRPDGPDPEAARHPDGAQPMPFSGSSLKRSCTKEAKGAF